MFDDLQITVSAVLMLMIMHYRIELNRIRNLYSAILCNASIARSALMSREQDRTIILV